MSDLTCRDAIARLVEHLDGSLDAGARAAVVAHLAACPECRAFAATYRRTRALTARVSRGEMPPPMQRRLLRLLRARCMPTPPADAP